MLPWHFSLHHKGVKEHTRHNGLVVPDEAAVRGQVFPKHVQASELATVHDLLRFHAPRVGEDHEGK